MECKAFGSISDLGAYYPGADACPHPVILLSAGEEILYANRIAHELFGSALKDVRGPDTLVAPTDRQRFRAAATLFSAVGGFKGRLQVLARGEPRYVDITWYRLPEGPAHSVVLFIDAHDSEELLTSLYVQLDRLEAATGASDEGWWEWSVGGSEVLFSRRSRALLGFSDERERQPLAAWTSRIDPAEREEFLDRLEAVGKAAAPFLQTELRVRRQDQWRRLFVRGSMVPGRGERPPRLVGMIGDVTEERRSRDDQRRYRHLFDHALEGLLIADAAGRIVEINQVGRNLCGLPSDAPLKQRLLQTAFDAEANAAFEAGLRAATNGLTWNKELVLRERAGDAVEVRASIFPIERDSVGNALMVGVVLHDVTFQKRAQRNDTEHRAALAHVLRLGTMGEMAGGVAHELNQPLAAIVNYLEGCLTRLRRGDAGREVLIDALQHAAHQAHLAGEIVARMRHYIRKEGSRAMLTRPEALVGDAYRFIEGACRHHNIAVEVHIDPSLPQILIDPIQIEQVLVNLASNGVDALANTPAGRRRLAFRVRRDGVLVVFSVCDSGSGVPEEWRQSIFEPFVTSKSASSHLGLGLSISKSLVESFGGSISLDDAPPGYTTAFSFQLPVAGALPDAIDSVF